MTSNFSIKYRSKSFPCERPTPNKPLGQFAVGLLQGVELGAQQYLTIEGPWTRQTPQLLYMPLLLVLIS
jgi:hypothetical protein